MSRIIKFPTAMVTGDYTASSLVLDGGSVIDQCIATAGDKGTFFLEQHLLYVVLSGEVRLTCGKQTCTVCKNEMVLLRRAHSVSYEKRGDAQTGLFESLLFAITDTGGCSLITGLFTAMTPERERDDAARRALVPIPLSAPSRHGCQCR